MSSRRKFLQYTFGSALAAALGCAGSKHNPVASSRAATDGPAPAAETKVRAIVLLYMIGGPSQIDTFDPKPDSENSAGVEAIDTAVSGIRISELLPQIATQAEHLAIVRSIVSSEGNHNRARHLMHTGYAPAGGVQHPAFGALVSKQRNQGALPGYVSIGGPGAGAGFLGTAHNPFAVGKPGTPPRNLARADGVDAARFDSRLALQQQLDESFTKSHASPILESQRDVTRQAVAMMNATERVAFDLGKESATSREAYGDSDFGKGCLLARRLVEAGVPFVEVMQRGWDTHQDHADRTNKLCADLDRGMAALISDLSARGLLESTLIVWTGDFGRNPKMNLRGGRDHYPAVTPAVFAGGGTAGGQVIGATDPDGVAVIDGAVTVPDMFRSIAEAAGLDPERSRMSRAGRPIATVDGGTVIPGLFG